VLFELGQILLVEGRLHDAVTRYQELRWAYPTFERRRPAQLQLADIYFQLGEYGEAIELYHQLSEGEAGSEETDHIRRRLAQAYHRSGAFTAALETYRQLLEQSPPSTGLDSVYFSQAILLAQLGREEEAISLFLRVRDEFASSVLASQAAVRAGHLFFALERYDRAYRAYQPLLATMRDTLAYGQAVLSLYRLQRLEEARNTAKNFAKRFGNKNAWTQQFRLEEGQYFLKKKDYSRALKLFRKVEEQGGEWTDDGAYYAALTLWEQNAAAPSPETATRALEVQARFIRQYGDSPHIADVYMRLGDYHSNLHNYLQAAGAYKRVLEHDARKELAQEAIWRLLRSYQSAHEYDEAHRIAAHLLRNFPEHPRTRDAQLETGIILKEKGQYAQAIFQLEKVLEWAEGNQASEARFYIGESYQNMGEYRKAIEAYYRVGFYGADGASQWITSADYKRALCHESLSEYATAIAVYERIVQREGSSSPQGALAEERISALRQHLEKR
jgi:tetratricopeptide (TPR) repeat protein